MGSRRRSAPRFRGGETIAGIGAAVLLVAMFFPWYDAEPTGRGTLELIVVSVGRNAWQALDAIAVVVALAPVAALGVVALRVRGGDWSPVISLDAVVAVLGGLAAALILFRLIVPPGLDVGGLGLEVTPSPAAFVGLAAALGIASGGYRAMREEGSSFATVADALQQPREQPASRRRSPSSSD